ncbi:MAG: hypothetical protein WBG02_16130 [Candidatus Acidiferrum sp.]
MLDTRRFFLKGLAGLSSSAFLFQSCPPIPTPRVRTPINPPPPAEPSQGDNTPDDHKIDQRAQLHAQEKQFRETMDRLCFEVNDLKRQVDAIHTAEIFSVDIFKETKEIEKLAKQLKNYAKS